MSAGTEDFRRVLPEGERTACWINRPVKVNAVSADVVLVIRGRGFSRVGNHRRGQRGCRIKWLQAGAGMRSRRCVEIGRSGRTPIHTDRRLVAGESVGEAGLGQMDGLVTEGPWIGWRGIRFASPRRRTTRIRSTRRVHSALHMTVERYGEGTHG